MNDILIDNTDIKILYWEDYGVMSVESQRCALNDISDNEYFVCEYLDTVPTLECEV